ncbi:hypothetical protein G6F35_015767 [Rhizopus arrhizus]|nr:hypothetical protein G6F35_015767 [Rhizopus arrhizus]
MKVSGEVRSSTGASTSSVSAWRVKATPLSRSSTTPATAWRGAAGRCWGRSAAGTARGAHPAAGARCRPGSTRRCHGGAAPRSPPARPRRRLPPRRPAVRRWDLHASSWRLSWVTQTSGMRARRTWPSPPRHCASSCSPATTLPKRVPSDR